MKPKLKLIEVKNHFTLQQIERMIAVVEGDITKNIVLLEEKKQPLEEALQMYQSYQSEFDEVNNKLISDKDMLQTLVSMRSGRKKESVRIIRQTSNLAKPVRSKPSIRIKWKVQIIEILKEIDRFITKEDLYKIILQKNPEIAKVNNIKGKYENNLWYIFNRENNKKKTLINHRNKIGLPQWVVNGIILPNYIKDFISVE